MIASTAPLLRLPRVAAFAFLCFGLAGVTAVSLQAKVATEPLVIETKSGSHKFQVEVAKTDSQRAIGLMYRKSLPDNAGMLFIYDTPQPIFMWMKNTLIPLDMVFITSKGAVHRIETRTEPYSEIPIGSEGNVIAVLELNGGAADKLGLKAGDRISSSSLDAARER